MRSVGVGSAFALVVAATLGLIALRSAPTSHVAARAARDGRVGETGRGVEQSVRDPNAGYAGWFYGQRSAPGKHVPSGALAAAVTQTQALRAKGALTGAVWQNLGPAP